MTGDEEQQLFAEMFRHLDKIEPWLKRMDPSSPHPTARERSIMRRDDKETHPYQLSQAAWHALSHAVDHLHCLRTVLKDAHVMHMYAPYSLARAALENASAAVWLLAPDDRAERILRRLRFATLDIRGGEAMKKLLGATGPKTEAERLDEVRAIARRRGVPEAAAVKAPGYAEIVKTAGDTMPSGHKAFLITWKMCSAIAHGDFWATLNVVSRTELPGAPAGFAHMRITANVQSLFFAVFFAVQITGAGWRLYDDRSQTRRAR
ncbi:hypothetical protein [Micromonospora sp. U21]|uniref:hypothetical protein n=1 Tax=Micromonospora sp. U21 TaxID=2824899 RepID=UPI001B3855B0|nr:hypothetical protein [Micromonospora sp. U21]MBQ0906959.1 hypothetical protein [Micromonospora sp. U21]